MTNIPSTQQKPSNQQDEKETRDEAEKPTAFFSSLPVDEVALLKSCRKRPSAIIHAAFQRILDEMRLVVETADSSKPSGLLIMGDSDNGKSTLLNYFCKRLAKEASQQYSQTEGFEDGYEKPLDEIAVKPAFLFSIPAGVTANGLLSRALSENGIPIKNRMTLERLENLFYEKLRQLNTRVILVDEFHDIDSLGAADQHLVLKVLKEMTNNLSIPIIAAGTLASRSVAMADEQVLTRFRPVILEPFKIGADFRDFLATYEKAMGIPLPNSMPLNSKGFVGYIHTRTNGLVGQVAHFLSMAYEKAVRDKADGITKNLLENISFIPLATAMSNPPEPKDLAKF